MAEDEGRKDGPGDVEEKRGYKSVEGVARFLVKRIEDGWLVQSIIGIDGASEAADCDMGYYLVENKEELMVLRISKKRFEAVEKSGSFETAISRMMRWVFLNHEAEHLREGPWRRMVLAAIAEAYPEYAKERAFWTL